MRDSPAAERTPILFGLQITAEPRMRFVSVTFACVSPASEGGVPSQPRRWGLAETHGSGSTANAALFTADGSSRSLMYSSVPLGRGTLNAEFTKPTGTAML